ncbi:helix-turn-helix domain-containing protein [Paenibacillus sp. CN-4]|uniref:helix-turn-helix domain-containing protein n=1 Tax=Paenibacillus nanchangensis TaxID=3348343 RepID=UPI003979A5A1
MKNRAGAGWKKTRTAWRGTKGTYYRKNLIMVLVVSAIPGLIIGALVYWMAGGRLENELLDMHNRQIEQRAANINDQLSNLELMLAHWAFDPKFDYSLSNLDLATDHAQIWDITKTLVVMQGSNTLADRVELYLSGRKQPSLLFAPEYGTVGPDAVSESYDKLLDSDQSTYWTQWAFNPSRPEVKELTLVHHIPGGSLQPFGSLLLRMDAEKVAALLRTMTPYNDGETFLMGTTGNLFVSGSGSGASSPFVTALKSNILNRGIHGNASFLFNWNGGTYAVTYGTFSRIASDWLYVSASPITSITSPVVSLSRVILLVSASALLLAAALSWFASRQMYSPVRRLFQTVLPDHGQGPGDEDEFTLIERQWQALHGQSHALSLTLSEQLPQVKQSFLNQLFQGYLYGYSEQELRERMLRYQWETEDCRFIVLHIQLTGISSLGGKFRNGDESLVSFAAANIIGELAAEHFGQAETINFHNLTAGMLIIQPEGESEPVLAFAEALISHISRMLNLRVTIAYSPAVSAIRDVPRAYEAAQQAVSYRQFGGGSQIIDMERMNRDSGAAPDPKYSFMLERGLLQALRSGDAEEADRLLQEFLEALRAGEAKMIDVQQGMLQLLGSIQHAAMDAGIHPNQLFKDENLYARLSQIQEPTLILSWFREKVISPFLKELSERTDAGIRQTIERAIEYIREHYTDGCMSLDSCAEYTGTSPFLLSRSFKRMTGQNFIDYVTGLRLDKAKELLRDTDLRINDVADRVGYQQSYFNRLFKKQQGITPTRYRELCRSGGAEQAERGGK